MVEQLLADLLVKSRQGAHCPPAQASPPTCFPAERCSVVSEAPVSNEFSTAVLLCSERASGEVAAYLFSITVDPVTVSHRTRTLFISSSCFCSTLLFF